MSDAPPPKRLIDPTITAGNLLQVLTLLGGIALWLISGRGKIDQTAAEVADLKSQMSSQAVATREQLASQASGTRESLREGLSRVEGPLAALNQQLQTLPPISERLRRAEADIARLQEADSDMSTRIENRRNIVDGRLDALRQSVTEATTRLEAISRASGVNLPGAPGIRNR